MQELKAKLLIIGREMRDTGSPEQQSAFIDTFLAQLQTLITEELIETFDVGSIRGLYQYWAKEMIESKDLYLARKAISEHLWVQVGPRTLAQKPKGENIVSIFSQTRH